MAIKLISLQPVLDKRASPLVYINRIYDLATDSLKIVAGYNLEQANHYELLALKFQFNASAVVANRYVTGRIYRDVENVALGSTDYFKSSVITASQARDIALMKNSDFANITTYGDYLCMNAGAFVFRGNDYLFISTTGADAGDKISTMAVFRWLNWDYGLESNPNQLVHAVKRKGWLW